MANARPDSEGQHTLHCLSSGSCSLLGLPNDQIADGGPFVVAEWELRARGSEWNPGS